MFDNTEEPINCSP